MYKYFALCLLVASAFAVPAPESESISQSLDCMQHDDDMLSCFAIKAVNAFNRAARSADVKVFEGITFVRDTPVERSAKSVKSEKEMLMELPRDATDKTMELFNMLFESAVSFFKSHSLKINVPEGSVSRSLSEGRAKIKKMILPLVAAAGVKIFALVPILLGGLALLVAKALFVGKIALLIAGVLAFNRMFAAGSGVGSAFGSNFAGNLFGKNPGNSWYDSNQGWSSASASNQGQQGYYRSFSDKASDAVPAQKLAYAAQAPAANNETN